MRLDTSRLFALDELETFWIASSKKIISAWSTAIGHLNDVIIPTRHIFKLKITPTWFRHLTPLLFYLNLICYSFFLSGRPHYSQSIIFYLPFVKSFDWQSNSKRASNCPCNTGKVFNNLSAFMVRSEPSSLLLKKKKLISS